MCSINPFAPFPLDIVSKKIAIKKKKGSMSVSLSVQMYLPSLVEFLCLVWRNDAVWLLYLVLKSFSVVLLSLCVGVAW